MYNDFGVTMLNSTCSKEFLCNPGFHPATLKMDAICTSFELQVSVGDLRNSKPSYKGSKGIFNAIFYIFCSFLKFSHFRFLDSSTIRVERKLGLFQIIFWSRFMFYTILTTLNVLQIKEVRITIMHSDSKCQISFVNSKMVKLQKKKFFWF